MTRKAVQAAVQDAMNFELPLTETTPPAPTGPAPGAGDTPGNLPPWHGSRPPDGWKLNSSGVYRDARRSREIAENEPERWERVSGPIWIDGVTRSHTGSGWGSAVRWVDRDGRFHERAIPAGRFHEQGPALAQELAGDGLLIVPGMERRLIQYLGSFEDERRILSVDRLGWLDTKAGTMAYVLPCEVIAKAGNERILFQPEEYAPTAATIHSSGALADWQQQIARPCGDHPLLLFGICAALSAPLMKPGGLDGGGFHVCGKTTGGKTTLLQAAASVWGCGADPAYAGDLALTRRWNATANGIEGLAAAHNDGPLCLDEIGTCNAKDFGGLVYNLAGGQGKIAMNFNRGLKHAKSWQVLILSTGEISSRAKIEQDGRTAKGGQLLRLIDIPVPDGGTLAPIPDPARFADELKRNCGQLYGTAGPAFVRALVNHAADAQALRNWTAEQLNKAADLLTVPNLAPEQARALKRFALALVAGLAAVERGILPLSKAAIVDAVKHVRGLWLAESHGTATDAERAIESVRAFILKHADSRFTIMGGRGDSEAGDGRPVVNRAGYRDLQRGLWLLTPDGFKEASDGHDPKAVARELHRRDWLHLNRPDRLMSGHRIPGLSHPVNLYAVKDAAITESGNDEAEPA